MPETAADHIAMAQDLARENDYVGAQAHAAIAQAILAHADAQQWQLVDAWHKVAERFHKSGNLEYAIGVLDCEKDLREVLRHKRRPIGG